jgi:hypothetical protein
MNAAPTPRAIQGTALRKCALVVERHALPPGDPTTRPTHRLIGFDRVGNRLEPADRDRGKLGGMDWHRTDAWKRAHLAMVEDLGIPVLLGCDGCRHHVVIAPRELADRHGLDMQTLLHTVSRALRSRAAASKGHARAARRRRDKAMHRHEQELVAPAMRGNYP